MNEKKIIFLTGTRADFGKLKSLISITSDSQLFEAHVFVTGMHLDSKFGRTADEVQASGFEHVFLYENHNTENGMEGALASTIHGFSNYVNKVKPDLIVIHGDRGEALAGAIVGSINNVLVVHIEGGELSGTIDDSFRHATSKMAHIHMVSNFEAKKRLMQLGEIEKAVYVIGSPDLDLMDPYKLPCINVVKSEYNIDFDRFGLCIFHPVTTELDSFSAYAKSFFNAVRDSGKNYIVIYPNNDFGTEFILSEIKGLQDNDRFRVFPSIRFEYFLRVLKESDFIVGNSSVGIREAPYFGVPTINVGSRQNNRSKVKSILNVGYEYSEILSGLKNFHKDKFVVSYSDRFNFGYGNSDKKFLNIISQESFYDIPRQKLFQDMSTVSASSVEGDALSAIR